MKSNCCVIVTAIFLFSSTFITAQKVVINELMPSNSRTIADEDGDFSDWIELFNTQDSAISLAGYGLSDNSTDLFKCTLPDINISNKDYLLIFASGKSKYLHTNFKLDAESEKIFITNPQGTIIDSVSTSTMLSDISFGRQPDGSNLWFYFNEPSPGNSNITAGFSGIAIEPVFSIDGGFYTGPVMVSLSGGFANNVIHYTLDGSVPTESSTIYSQPIQISTNKVLRARTFSAGLLPGKTVTNTYLINFSTELPVFSIATDPKNFFDDEIGIYVMGNSASTVFPYFGANFWNDWERPIHVELFDINNSGFSLNAGIKIFGGWSRAYPQKSLAIFARGSYGSDKINYPLFPDLPFTEYESFILRNSGDDWYYTMFRDGLMTSLVDGIDLDKQDFRPAVLFLNGEYWGIHNLREKVNEDFLAMHNNVDQDNLDILENYGVIVTGDNIEYMNLFSFIENNNMALPANYEYVKSKIDVNNFIKYYVSEIYFDNKDWPGNNIKYWKERNSGKWRWILFDTDFGFDLFGENNYLYNTLVFATEPNGQSWPNPPWSTLLLRKLLENQTFRNDFINCAADLLNSNFLPNRVSQKIISMKEDIETEIPRHIDRWGAFNLEAWNNNIQTLINFSNLRPDYFRSHIIQKFGLPGATDVNITISHTSMGSIKLNSLEINIPEWTGSYFLNVPINLIAKPKIGYRFVHWEGATSTNEDSITIIPNSSINLNAVFEVDSNFPKIVINEINYNSSPAFNPQDWIEFYNNSDTSVNISGWVFEDSDISHNYIIPEGTTLSSGEYLVLCNDNNLFKPLFLEVQNYLGNFNFGLSGDGELLKLFNRERSIIDSLTYDDQAPWPENADGNGSTMSLINPNLENNLPESWAASLGYGTPGSVNDVFVSIEEETSSLPTDFCLMQNYPNPFNPTTKIKFTIPTSTSLPIFTGVRFVSLRVYDILGREVATLVNLDKPPGVHEVEFDGSKLSSGVYFYTLKVESFVQTKKLILLK